MATRRITVRDGFVHGAGARIYYKTLGRGLPLVLLHGGPGADHSDFLPALRPLASHCRLVLIDERGSGRSERLVDPRGYTLENMVKDLECVRRALRLGPFVLLGHSFGGTLAQAYAATHPRRLAGLVLAGTGSRARDIDADFRGLLARLPARLRKTLRSLEAQGIFDSDGSYRPRYAAASAQALAPAMHARQPPPSVRQPMPLGMEVLREMYVRRSDFIIDGNLKGFDFTGSLARLRVPALVVIGDRDIVSPASAERSRAALRHATLVVMADAAHMMFIDQPNRFRALLLDFVRQCAQALRAQRR